jgi:hypothetical protein
MVENEMLIFHHVVLAPIQIPVPQRVEQSHHDSFTADAQKIPAGGIRSIAPEVI